MPKEDTGLLGEIVGQLKKLNASSQVDMLREAEALKRAEKLQVTTETATDLSGVMVDDTKDFQRRFISAQASQIMNEERRLKPAREKSTKATEKSRDAIIADAQVQLQMRTLSEINVDYLRDISDHLFVIGSNTTKLTDVKTTPIDIDLSQLDFDWGEDLGKIREYSKYSRMDLDWIQEDLREIKDAALSKGSLYVHDLSVQESIGQILSFDEKRANELDRQRNTDLRSAEERRREMIKNANRGAGGIGAGTGDGGDGSFFGDMGQKLWQNITNNPIATAITGGGLLFWKRIAGWMGYGKYAKPGDSLWTRIFFRMQLWGEWLKLKFTGRALAANPNAAKALVSGNRFIMLGAIATLAAWTFWDNILSAFNLSDEAIDTKMTIDSQPTDTINMSASADHDNVADSSGPKLETLVNLGFAAQWLSKAKWTQRIAQYQAEMMHLRFSAALPGSWQERMFKHMQKGRLGSGLKFTRIVAAGTGRAFMLAFGWPGMLAYAAYSIADWKLSQIAEVENSAKLWLYDDKDLPLDVLASDSYRSEFAKPLQMGTNLELDKRLMDEKKKRILDLMRGKSQENLKKIFNILSNLGWNDADLVEFMKMLKDEKSGDLASLDTKSLLKFKSTTTLGQRISGLQGSVLSRLDDGTMMADSGAQMLASNTNIGSQDFNQIITNNLYVSRNKVKDNLTQVSTPYAMA